MEKTEVILFGAGGHAKVISSLIKDLNHTLVAAYDSKQQFFQGLQTIDQFQENLRNVVISIGDNYKRKQISLLNNTYISLIHPSSSIAESVEIGVGSMIVHKSIIQASSVIGKHVIINTNSIVDHDCFIGDFVHVAPNATLCGNVVVGEGTLIGASATILPGIKIGKWCVVGAGSVVTEDIPDNKVVFGVPAVLKD